MANLYQAKKAAGAEVYLNGVKQDVSRCDITDEYWQDWKALPYAFDSGAAVVLNNEIHILGGTNNPKAHYKWNGTEWVSVSTLPADLKRGNSACVLNNEIYIFTERTPDYNTYKWNGSSWVALNMFSANYDHGAFVILNGEMYGVGGIGSQTKMRKWNGSGWTDVATIPYNFAGCAVVLNGEIHILGSSFGTSTLGYYHYKWNGSEWVSVSTLPRTFGYSGRAFVKNGEINILGGSSGYKIHQKWNGTEWVNVSTLPFESNNSSCVQLDSKTYILGSNRDNAFTRSIVDDSTFSYLLTP